MIADLFRESHIKDEEMILLGDGELSRRRVRCLRHHLERCWGCRARFESLQGVITEFVERCDLIVRDCGGTPSTWQPLRPAEGSLLPQRQLDQEVQPAFRNWHISSRPHALATLAVAVSLLVVLFYDGAISAARAAAIMQEASDTDSRRYLTKPGAVVHQKLEVAGRSRRLEWNSWWSPEHGEMRSSWQGDSDLKAGFLKDYSATRLSRFRPLSPIGFRKWQAEARARSSAREDYASHSVVIHSVAQGSLRESSLTISRNDLHSSTETLQIVDAAGTREYTIRELSFELLPPAEPNTLPPVPKIHSKAAARIHPAVTVSEPLTDTQADLDIVEARVRWLLRQRKADVRLNPEIGISHGKVIVRMTVEEPEEREQWLRALSAIPHVAPEVWTVEDTPRTAHFTGSQSGAPLALFRSSAPLASRLERCLGSAENATAAIDRTHTHLRAALAPALALDRLHQRYPIESMPGLLPEVQAIVAQIDAGLTGEVVTHVRLLHTVVDPILIGCFASGPAVAQTITSHSIAQNLRAADSYFNQLFTNQISSAAPVSPEDSLQGLSESLNALTEQFAKNK